MKLTWKFAVAFKSMLKSYKSDYNRKKWDKNRDSSSLRLSTCVCVYVCVVGYDSVYGLFIRIYSREFSLRIYTYFLYRHITRLNYRGNGFCAVCGVRPPNEAKNEKNVWVGVSFSPSLPPALSRSFCASKPHTCSQLLCVCIECVRFRPKTASGKP